jgi:mono/diheme cytochrome c family protein
MSDADIAAIVQHGGPALNRSALMPPYANTLSPAEVQAVIAYIRVVADPPYQPSGTVYARK